ncbi:MAG: hypothetical protein VB933_05850 [Pseudomonadales bacterium]
MQAELLGLEELAGKVRADATGALGICLPTQGINQAFTGRSKSTDRLALKSFQPVQI